MRVRERLAMHSAVVSLTPSNFKVAFSTFRIPPFAVKPREASRKTLNLT